MPLLQDYLACAASVVPDKIALVCGERRMSYRELHERSNVLAHVLCDRGIERGDRVIVFADNTVETVISFWAVLKAGAVVSLVNPLTKAQKLRYLIEDCTPRALITDAHLYEAWVEATAHPCVRTLIVAGILTDEQSSRRPDALAWDDVVRGECPTPPAPRTIDIDLAAIIYTSGSSGDPKGVMLTHRSMLTAATSVSRYLEIGSEDVILNVLPLAFDYGLYQMIMACRQQARLILERSFAYPARTLELIAREGITVFPGVPTIFAMLGAMKTVDEYDFSGIHCVTNTAAALGSKHIELLKALFPAARIYSMYGLTECKRCTYLPPEDLDRKPGSVGIAIPNTELWLVDDEGRRLAEPDAVGQLVIRGATVMKGYWGKPAATAEKLKAGPFPGEQVLYTGDYCRLDSEGYLYFVGRMDDIIKCRGEKVAPKEVEAVITDLAGVQEAAVIGVPDEILGHAVKAFVVLEPGAAITENEVRRVCQQKLESFMVPRVVSFVSALPKTNTGKISKKELR